MAQPLYATLASLLIAVENCKTSGNAGWQAKHTERILQLCKDLLPSGSGIDSGTKIDLDKSTPDKLIFHTAFHHMNEGGMYDGWTEHTVTVTASLAFGFNLKISGRNRNDIKDYLGDLFHQVLGQDVTE